MMPEKLSHRALMLMINAKQDYIIAELSALAFAVRTNSDGYGRVANYRGKARKKLESEIKRMVALDKTKGGFNGN